MTTNTVCTILRDDGGEMKAAAYYPCMWQERSGIDIGKHITENDDTAAIYIPDISADIIKGDLISRQDKDADDALVVISVTRHDYGSANMRHIKVTAR